MRALDAPTRPVVPFRFSACCVKHRCDPADVALLLIELGAATRRSRTPSRAARIGFRSPTKTRLRVLRSGSKRQAKIKAWRPIEIPIPESMAA